MKTEDILESKSDWEWHKAQLDVSAKYKHQHNGDPEKYPCRVESHWYDDPNGPYTYDHTFTYQQSVKCGACGHVEIVWPAKSGETPEIP